MSVIEVKDIKKNYKDLVAVAGVSFSVEKGEVFGLLGPNGAGKTTTVEMLEGITKIDEGEAFIEGIKVSQNNHELQNIIGVSLQSNNFFDDLSLSEILNLFASFFNIKINPLDFLAEVTLTEKSKTKFKDMSGGQKQRFTIALALINDPKVLFLDEPTTGLDPQSRRHLWDIVSGLKKKGKTIILTTHFMDEAEYLADRVAVMDSGKILKMGTPKELIQELISKGFVKKVVADERANLEDVFIDLTGKNLRD
jgi:ABC-2 type transport system ATP-binding protein